MTAETETGPDAAFREAEKILNGGDDYTDHMTARYLLDLMKNINIHTPAAYRFCAAAKIAFPARDMKKIRFPAETHATRRTAQKTAEQKAADHKVYENLRKAPRDSVSEEDWRVLRAYLQDRLEKSGSPEEPAILRNLLRLADRLGFGPEEKAVVRLLHVAENYELDHFMGAFAHGDRKMAGPLAAWMLDQPKNLRKVERLLGAESPLLRYGVFHMPMGDGGFLPGLDEDLWQLLSTENLDEEALVSGVLGKPTGTELTLDDFAFIGRDLAFMTSLVNNAVAQGQPGVNILIYGPPGGGKSELARALAKHLDLSMYAVGEEENRGGGKEVSPLYDVDGEVMGTSSAPRGEERVSRQRLAHLMRTQALLSGNRRALIMFDEIEDLLLKGTDTDKKADTDSKIEINRLLEKNPVVTIWVGNDTEKFHEAVRDRFIFSLYVDYQPTLVRRKIWERQLQMNNVELPGQDILTLARAYDATPRQIAKAVLSAAITGEGMEAIRVSMPASSKISYNSSEAVTAGNRIARTFDPALLNVTGADGAERLDALLRKGAARRPFSLMATGAKGTGVNSMLRYLGERMTMNVLEVSVGALVQPSMSSTPEGNVAMAFAAAADGRRFMIIKDLENLVPDPGSAGSQWHGSSLVDAFVRNARAHRLPFAVTSHAKIGFPEFITHLFSERISLDFLDDARSRQAFKAFFGREVPEGIDLPQGLSLADFSGVKRLMARDDDAGDSRIVEMLARQRQVRHGGENRPSMGFY